MQRGPPIGPWQKALLNFIKEAWLLLPAPPSYFMYPFLNVFFIFQKSKKGYGKQLKGAENNGRKEALELPGHCCKKNGKCLTKN